MPSILTIGSIILIVGFWYCGYGIELWEILITLSTTYLYNHFKDIKKQKLENQNYLKVIKYFVKEISKLNYKIKNYYKLEKSVKGGYLAWEKITEYFLGEFSPPLDLSKLEFLVSYNDGRYEKVLDSILVVYQSYKSLTGLIDRRNKLYSSYLEKTPDRECMTLKDLEERIGSKNYYYLHNYTEKIIKTSEALSEDCLKALKEIDNFLKAYIYLLR